MAPNNERFFAALPFELRIKIWESTIAPRVINFINDKKTYDEFEYMDPGMRYKLQEGALEPIYPRKYGLSIDDTDLPRVPALSACRESRKFATSKGYRPWKVRNMSDEFRYLMWNPELDTVCFNRIFGMRPLLLFSIVFPVEIKLVRYLALPSNLWEDDNQFLMDTDVLWKFESLRSICVVVNILHEYRLIRTVEARQPSGWPIPPWVLPGSIVEGFLKYTARRGYSDLHWKMPWVRVVECEKDILAGETKKVVLRCLPCVDMPRLLLIEGESERLKAFQAHWDATW